MSIAKLTDAQVMERIKPKDDREELEQLASRLTNNTLYSAAVLNIPGGVTVRVIDRSGRIALEADCELPNDNDDMFTIAGKRRFIRIVRDRLVKLLNDNSPGAA
jgi:hypothetical protein